MNEIINNMNDIEHYKRFPCMKPWVGDKYKDTSTKRLLLIGESHYLPKGSTVHLEDWYKKTQKDLNEQERGWISTSDLIKDEKDNNFPARPHGMFRNPCNVINSISFQYELPSKVIEHYVFYNYFQRPADETRKSINPTEKDKEVAKSVLESLLKILKPELIVFVSRKAGDHGKEVIERNNIPYIAAPHPGISYWNKTVKTYGNKKGRELVSDFLIEHKWKKT